MVAAPAQRTLIRHRPPIGPARRTSSWIPSSPVLPPGCPLVERLSLPNRAPVHQPQVPRIRSIFVPLDHSTPTASPSRTRGPGACTEPRLPATRRRDVTSQITVPGPPPPKSKPDRAISTNRPHLQNRTSRSKAFVRYSNQPRRNRLHAANSAEPSSAGAHDICVERQDLRDYIFNAVRHDLMWPILVVREQGNNVSQGLWLVSTHHTQQPGDQTVSCVFKHLKALKASKRGRLCALVRLHFACVSSSH